MGAKQSTAQGDSSSAAVSTPAKTCYYELLALDRQATDEDIKKAYRRKALELHPDRNIDNVAVATQKFAEVQAAYEVLSDPQERAWYDSHRDAILRGNDGPDDDQHPTTYRNVRLTSTEEIHSLISRFNATIPFNDEPTGFFGITRETFEHLAMEEEAAADLDDIDCPDYPSFGSSDDNYDSVVRLFYVSWSGFSTRKSFVWMDKYRLADAPDRRVRRMMEKENKKIREDAIRDFNEAVRFLVGFVRKRDPRYLPNTQTDSERQKSMRDAAAAQAAKARAANQEKMASYQVPDWAKSREESAEDDYSVEGDEEDEESEPEVLECIVCNKKFKSEQQLQAHERSKKHVKAVQQLRWRMKKEGAELELETELVETVPGNTDNPDMAPEREKIYEAPEEGERKKHNDPVGSLSAIEGSANETPDSPAVDETSDDDEYAPRDVIEDRLASNENGQDGTAGHEADLDTATESDLAGAIDAATLKDHPIQKKLGKAKAKREKKAAQRLQADTHRCSVCAEEFASRTKLFQHIQDEGHAAPVTIKPPNGKKGKQKR